MNRYIPVSFIALAAGLVGWGFGEHYNPRLPVLQIEAQAFGDGELVEAWSMGMDVASVCNKKLQWDTDLPKGYIILHTNNVDLLDYICEENQNEFKDKPDAFNGSTDTSDFDNGAGSLPQNSIGKHDQECLGKDGRWTSCAKDANGVSNQASGVDHSATETPAR